MSKVKIIHLLSLVECAKIENLREKKLTIKPILFKNIL